MKFSAIECMVAFHEKVRELIHPEIPAQQLAILFRVAQEPGVTHTDLGRDLDMPQGSVSRNVQKLAIKLVSKVRGPSESYGYGLVENRPDYKTDSRRNAVYLTNKGELVIADLIKTFNQCIQKDRGGMKYDH